MDLINIVLIGLFSFFIIAGAVRFAIEPLVNPEGSRKPVKSDNLYKLRDEGIISEQEIKEYLELAYGVENYDKIEEDYYEGKKVLEKLFKEKSLSYDEYLAKLEKLKDVYISK